MLILLGVGVAACDAPVPRGDAGSSSADADVAPDPDGGLDCERCDDDNPCTLDVCEADGGCRHVGVDARCDVGERCAAGFGCAPIRCARDQHCSNGIYCDGVERCDPTNPAANAATGCMPGIPVDCADRQACTNDRCDESSRTCTHEPDDSRCSDDVDCTIDRCHVGTGCSNTVDHDYCAGLDWCVTATECHPLDGCIIRESRNCSDDDPCTFDSCDGAARVCESAPWDADEDGIAAMQVAGVECGGTDCDDYDIDVHPGAVEACDGEDDDCDGIVDERCDSAPDNCATVEVLSGTTWPIEVTGSFDRLAHDMMLPCLGPGLTRDALFAVDISQPSDVRVEVPADAPAFGIGLGDEHCPASTFGDLCAVSGPGEARILLLHGVGPLPDGAPRRVHILVAENAGSTTSSYRFSLSVTPRPSATCDSPIDLGSNATVEAWISDTDGRVLESACGFPSDATRREHVYRVAAGDRVRADIVTATFVPQLDVRAEGCAGDLVGCMHGRSLGRYVRVEEATSPGSHYVIVDGGEVGDSYRLRVD